MCEYCEKGKTLISEERLDSDFEYYKFNTFIWKDELITKNENEPCLEVDEKCKINYCPMCGRKLIEQNEDDLFWKEFIQEQEKLNREEDK